MLVKITITTFQLNSNSITFAKVQIPVYRSVYNTFRLKCIFKRNNLVKNLQAIYDDIHAHTLSFAKLLKCVRSTVGYKNMSE